MASLIRSLSESTRALLQRLYKSRPTHQSSAIQAKEAHDLQQIGESREPAAIPALVWFLCNGNQLVAKAAATAIQQIVDKCDLCLLAQLDKLVREASDWRAPPVSAHDVRRLSLGMVETLGILSFHGSGFVREVAVRELADRHDGTELRFLLIRLNDWVLPVRSIASAAVAQRIRTEYAPHFLRCSPLIERLRQQKREDHQAVVDAILGLLRSHDCRSILRSGLHGQEHQTCRMAFRLLVEPPADDLMLILYESIESNDTVIRLWAARMIREKLDGQPLREVLERFSKDRFMPVRREALYGFYERLASIASDRMRMSLLDPHASMRDLARFFLRQFEISDFASYYRNCLTDMGGNELASAIAGLGETGIAEDTGRLTQFVENPNHRIRRAAIRAIAALDFDGNLDAFLIALQDSSASVAKAARDILLVHAQRLSSERLWSIFESSGTPHVRPMVLPLIARLRWWDGGALLILAAGSSDEQIAAKAAEYLRRWQSNPNRTSVRPTRGQLKKLESALKQRPPALDMREWDDLQFLLSYAKRELI